MNQLIVFAKAPLPGQVKTRLAATIGPEKTLEVYQLLLQALVRNLGHLPATVAYTPPGSAEAFATMLPAHWILEPQSNGDLGARLQQAFQQAFARGALRIAIIGSDCPEVTPQDITDAFDALKNHDLVLGPSHDGGYWLIAMKKLIPELLSGIHWSSSSVLAQTMEHARGIGASVHLLRTLRDVDTEEDWNELSGVLSQA